MADQEKFTDPAEIRHVIGAGGTFSLHGVSGDVEIRGADTEEARVIASSNGNADMPLVVRRSEGGLHIEVEQAGFDLLKRGRSHASIDFQVELPRQARVEVNGVSSDVEAHGLGGEQSYRSVSGDISINGHGGRISLNTVSGDAELRSDQPMSANLTTTSGDVNIAAPLLNALQLRTVSGDAEIRAGFAAGPIHSVESVSGDVSLEPLSGLTVEVKRGLDVMSGTGRQLVAGDGSARLRFRSLSGDLEFNARGARDSSPLAAPARTTDAQAPEDDQPYTANDLDVLRALERGEIDVEEASRRLEGASSRG
jgi:hypothetical protein